MKESDVEVHQLGADTLHCVLRGAHNRNALNPAMVSGLRKVVDRVESNDEIVCVVITAGASPDFCAGGDLKYLRELSTADALGFSDSVFQLCRSIRSSAAVWSAMLVGRTLGGGAELAMACDFRFAAVDAVMCFSQLKMGLPSGWGGFSRLVEEVGQVRALNVILQAEELDQKAQTLLGLSLAFDGEPLQAFDAWRSKWCVSEPSLLKSVFGIVKNRNERRVERNAFEQHWGEKSHCEALARFFDRS